MSQHVVIIGGVALGPKAACRFKRLERQSRVTMFDRDSRISYGGCGIPYYVSGDVSDAKELQNTAFHMTRDAKFFRDTKDVDVFPQTEVLGIDRAAKTVRVRHLPTGKEETVAYDKLVIATGSSPRRLPIPGVDLPGVHTVTTLDAAEAVRGMLSGGAVGSAVVIGAGFIGLEMAVALADMWGIETTVVEYADQILPNVIGSGLARMAQTHMEEKGVTFRLGAQVTSIEGDGKAERVTVKGKDGTDTLDAELVIMSVGVTPNSELAKAAGLEVSPRGGIVVDAAMRTSDPDIFAGGDCVEVPNLITGKPIYLPLGSMANRQGRVIGTNLARGTNLADGASRFEGAVGSWCVKLFDVGAAGTGLSLPAAKAAGFDAINVHVSQLDRAHFYPDKGLMSLELVVERSTRRILGMQGVSVMGDALVGKVNAVAALLPSAPRADVLGNLEMAYSPPYASAMDILNVLGNAADNILSGQNKGIGMEEFGAIFSEMGSETGAGGSHFLIDCREWANAEPFMEKHPGIWHNIPQGQLPGRLAEVPKDRDIVLICNTGARSYEALVILANAGYKNVVSVEGGMAAVERAGLGV